MIHGRKRNISTHNYKGNKMITRAPLLALILFAAIFATACEKKGPAEKAGEKIDNAISEAKDEAEDAAKEVEEAAEEAADKVKGD